MYRLASQQTPPLVITTPHIPHLQENNVHQGFFTDNEFRVLRAILPDQVKVPLIIAYWTGMRTGEILGLRWDQLDLERDLLRLEPGTTKNNQGRLLPLTKEVVEALWQWRQTLRGHPTCVWVCHYRGKRLRQIPRKRWIKACDRAGLKGKIFHDLRRTAIRNMVRAGVPERVAMSISGHKTRSVFDRYHIVSHDDLWAAKQRLDVFSKGGGLN
jgi:integrase